MQPLHNGLNATRIQVRQPEARIHTPLRRTELWTWRGPLGPPIHIAPLPSSAPGGPKLFRKSMAAVCQAAEAGYEFHGTLNGPGMEITGCQGAYPCCARCCSTKIRRPCKLSSKLRMPRLISIVMWALAEHLTVSSRYIFWTGRLI